MQATSISKFVFCLCLIACSSKIYKSDIDDCETLAWNRDHKILPAKKLKRQRHSQSLSQAKSRLKDSPAVSMNLLYIEPEPKDTAIIFESAPGIIASDGNEVMPSLNVTQEKIQQQVTINC